MPDDPIPLGSNGGGRAQMKFVLFGLGWAWAAWVTVTLYGCAARILEVREMRRRATRPAGGREDAAARVRPVR
ncbi:hypothetical protein P7B02_18805 [Caulobacter segnis]|uniref:hypothetical protein n=1 Tax=Caulobacter segnis TaxID=88688 RepID=UPI00240F79F1|nr:hypothetical protein [Caulobacter segnis]MDG2523584.1 hypothetical protein [Caulobacter segnis]